MAAGDGLISMKPTSITHNGTSASINSDGGVDFTAVTSLSLNGVFTSDYDNYLVVISGKATSDFGSIQYRLRASGSDNSTSNSYVSQRVTATGSTVSGNRTTSTLGEVMQVDSEQSDGVHWHVYGPALAHPTAARGVNVNGHTGAAMVDWASTHNQSTAYDGVTLIVSSSANATGTVHVFGYEE